MIALAPARSSRSSLASERSPSLPPPPLDLPTVPFFGRSLAEYCQFFALSPADLRRRPVLDVAAGPSSFTAEACRLGVDAVAVDPLYAASPAHLERQVEQDYARLQRVLEQRPEMLRLERRVPTGPTPYFTTLEAARRDRRAAARRFLEDFATHREHGRYFGAALPQLPFFDRAFDLVLCAHLLFVHGPKFDYAFYLAACRELVRVSREEVRIHPLCGPDGRVYPELGRLREDLAADAIDSQVLAVDYEFFVGTDTTLVLRRGRP